MGRAKRRSKPRQKGRGRHEHTIPNAPSDAALSKAVLRRIPHEEKAVREYVELEASGEHVTRLEKVATERLHGRQLDAWDVRTNKDRYWVITDPTNLYSQSDFPSLDYTISFHVGVTTRMMAHQRVRASEEEQDRFAGAWRKLEQSAEAFEGADEAEEFQSVGMRCRETLLAFVRGAGSVEMVPAGQEMPKRGDFMLWSEVIARAIARGDSATEVRTYLKAIARSAWQFVGWLTHAQNAVRMDAQLALDMTEHLLAVFGVALIRYERGAPDRCPVCSSYRITSVYQPELDIGHPYVSLCEACGWSSPEKDGTART